MAATHRGTRPDARLGRTDGSLLLSASSTCVAVRIQDCRGHFRTRTAHHLLAVYRPTKHGHRRKHNGSRTMTLNQPTRASTTTELAIVTAEGVVFRLPLASPASRLYAMAL